MRSLVFTLIILLGLPVWGKDIMDQRVYGSQAPSKMYLFTSLACPHCAQFHREILPEIQKKYLNTNQSQLVVVDMLMNKPNLMGAMLIRCVPEKQTESVEHTLYANQKNWAWDEKKARIYLSEIALKNGMSAGEFETCLANKDLENTIITEQERMARLYDIKHMPTLLVRQNEKTASWEGADKDYVMAELSDFFK